MKVPDSKGKLWKRFRIVEERVRYLWKAEEANLALLSIEMDEQNVEREEKKEVGDDPRVSMIFQGIPMPESRILRCVMAGTDF
jgi:hypothetical protein